MNEATQEINETTQAVLDSKPEKRSFLRKLGNFLMYGGWLLVVAAGLALMILFSHKGP